MMETRTHQNLKRLAAAYLWDAGYRVIALEVRCPSSRYRVDVAGYLDRMPYPPASDASGPTLWANAAANAAGRNRRCPPSTVVVECKQSRGDFIRDDRKADELLRLRNELRDWRTNLEEQHLKVHDPELRRSDSRLFPDMEDWDFAASRHTAYRRLVRRIRKVEAQLYGETSSS